jgi:hypothetical protein
MAAAEAAAVTGPAAVKFEQQLQDVEGLPAPPLPGDASGQAEVPAAVLDAEVKAELQTKLKMQTGSVEDVNTEIEPEGQQTAGETSDYELQRLRNIARNQRQLETLGLGGPIAAIKPPVARKRPRPPPSGGAFCRRSRRPRKVPPPAPTPVLVPTPAPQTPPESLGARGDRIGSSNAAPSRPPVTPPAAPGADGLRADPTIPANPGWEVNFIKLKAYKVGRWHACQLRGGRGAPLAFGLGP